MCEDRVEQGHTCPHLQGAMEPHTFLPARERGHRMEWLGIMWCLHLCGTSWELAGTLYVPPGEGVTAVLCGGTGTSGPRWGSWRHPVRMLSIVRA